jgi:hypothetical protein
MSKRDSKPARPSFRAPASLRPPILVAVAALPAVLGCSGDERGTPGVHVSYEGQNVPNLGVQKGPCGTEGDVKECSVVLGRYEGVVSCFVGVQTCIDGYWGPCGQAADSEDGAGGAGSP